MQREIYVIANSQNKSETYMSNAETLGELKAELIEKGYNVNDMDIKEGKSRTDLHDESTPLPSNFMYKGVETSDLVIMITPKNTKIKSGMLTRQELYAKVKEYGLQDAIKNEYGKNFTQVGSQEIACMVEKYEASHVTPAAPTTHVSTATLKETVREVVNEELDKREGEYSVKGIALCFLKFVNVLEGLKIGEYRLVSQAVCDNLRRAVRKDYKPVSEAEVTAMQH